MKKQDEKIMVSILCITYNHGKYIGKCLESFINQKTSFNYEIIVHDDVSSDNTREIIDKYYQKYPDKIVRIYQKENQFSKGVNIYKKFIIPKIRGKYFALCEGDDYFCDKEKLQKQFDFLERHPDYAFCVHNAIIVDREENLQGEISPLLDGGDLSCSDFIINGGAFVATNSIFSYSKYLKEMPRYFDIISIDYIFQIYLSSKGKTYSLKEYLSAYRQGVEGSWTKTTSVDKEKLIEYNKKIILALNAFNEDTDYIYDSFLKEKLVPLEYDVLEYERNYKKMKEFPYNEIRRKKSFKDKLRYFLYEHFPRFFKFLYRIIKGREVK